MKNNTTIYYFTGTGNSLKAAKDLAKQLEGGADLVPIAAEIKKEQIKPETENVGFIFPVHSMGPAVIVMDFIKKIDLTGVSYTFAASTMSSGYGVAMKMVEKALKKKLKPLNAAIGVRMGANNNFFMNIPGVTTILSPGDQEIAYKEAAEQINKLANAINNKWEIQAENPRGMRGFFISFIHNLFKGSVKKFGKKYSACEKCIGCKTCITLCPAGNIEMKEGQPHWNDMCLSCVACYNYCPQTAISHSMTTKPDMDKKYKHPDIDKKEIIAQKG